MKSVKNLHSMTRMSAEKNRKQPSSGSSSRKFAPADPSCSVLIVDDNEINCRVLFGFLRSLGFDPVNISTTTSAADALELCFSVTPKETPHEPLLSFSLLSSEEFLSQDSSSGVALLPPSTSSPTAAVPSLPLSSSSSSALFSSSPPPRFHLVLTDIHMPLLNGLEFTKRLLARDRRFVVIGVSADIDTNVSTSATEAGMIDLLTKPLVLVNVTKVLLRHGFVVALP